MTWGPPGPSSQASVGEDERLQVQGRSFSPGGPGTFVAEAPPGKQLWTPLPWQPERRSGLFLKEPGAGQTR